MIALSASVFTAPPAAFAACGDAVVDTGEDCDDGNAVGGDCCSSTCLFDPPATTCADDGGICTTDLCDGAGTCVHDAGNPGEPCRAAAGYGGGFPSAVPAGVLHLPFAISRQWFVDRATPCGPDSAMLFYPTGTAIGCGGWHTFVSWPANASRLRGILDGLKAGTFISPETSANADQFAFVGGAVASTFSSMQALYNSRKDANGNWTVLVGVYDSSSCANPNGWISIVGFATARITGVPMFPSKQIEANIDCAVIDFGEKGGSDFGTQVAVGHECDVAEVCDGIATTCPQDAKQASGVSCDEDGIVCTTDLCDGAGFCVHAAGNVGLECRGSTGDCDPAETCTGSGPDCPPAAVAPPTQVCRASAGTCDPSEYCDGSTDSCPIDTGMPDCGGSDLCCPSTCETGEDPDCYNDSLTFTNCRIKTDFAADEPDKYRVSCAVLDASGSSDGLHPDTERLWLSIRDASTTPAACLEGMLSPGVCVGGTCDSGAFELESCSKDRDCRPCRRTAEGFVCRDNGYAPGISAVTLRALPDAAGRRYRLTITGSTTDMQCSPASLPWSLSIAQGDDRGEVACTRIDRSRISCPGVE